MIRDKVTRDKVTRDSIRIRKKLGAWRARYFLVRLCGAAFRCAELGLWLGAAVMAATVLFGLSGEQILVFAVSAACWLLFRFYGDFISLLPSLSLARFSAFASGRLPGLAGHLRPALDLCSASPPGASRAFIERHLEVTSALLSAEKRPDFLSFRTALPGARLAGLAAGLCAFCVFALASPEAFHGLMHPFSPPPLENIMDIKPENAALLRGSAFRIEAVFRNGGRTEPELFMKSPGGGWARGFMSADGPSRFAYQAENLGGDLLYRFRHKGLESAVYRIKALDPPSLNDPVFSVAPPAYAGLPATEHPYLPAEIEVLKGSLVSVSGRCVPASASAALVFAGSGLRKPLNPLGAGRLGVRFAVFEDTGYHLELQTAGGLQGAGGQVHAIKAREDAPPLITLLSPAFPRLEAAPQEEIKALYEAEDDIGLAEITLERKVFLDGRGEAELSFSRSLKSFPGPAGRRFAGEAALEIYDLPDGAGAEFRVRACDRSPGGRCAESGPVNIKVVDFDARHAAAYSGLDALRKSAAALKEKEDGIIGRLRSSSGTFSNAEMDGLSAAWKALASGAARLGETLAADPYAGEAARRRYGLVERELGYAARAALEKAVPATLAGRGAEALKAHKELSGALESGAGELEAMLRSEGARSAAFGFENMARNTEAMAETLGAGGPASEADWKKLERTLARISAELGRINALLKDRPPRSDGGKVFALPAAGALGAAGELARAIARRDAGRAAALAAKLAEALSRMRRVMEEYADYEAAQNPGAAEGSKIGELAAAWKALAETQSAEATANQAVEERLFEKIEKARAARLGEAAALQAGLAGNMAAFKTENPAACSAALEASELLKTRDVEGARRMMEKTLFELKKSTPPPVSVSSFSLQSSVFSLEQERVLLMASKLGSDAAFLDPADLELFDPAARRQGGIEAKSGELYARIDGEYSGELAAKLLERLGKARGHMFKASEALAAREMRPAVSSQLKALEELELGGEDLDEMIQSLAKAQAAPGAKGRPSGVFARSADGLDASPVRLPKPGDYAPPEDLRRKVMDSLRERYPASRRELIEEYFKGITR